MPKYTLKAVELKFITDEDKKKYNHGGWTPLNENLLQYGLVCYLTMDRCPDSDIFVIIGWYKEDNDTILKVVYPRIRIFNDKICLGQDKSDDEMKITHDSKCQLNNIRQGCDFDCTCGAEERFNNEYSRTFRKAYNNMANYEIYTINMNKCHWYIGCQYSDEKRLKLMDMPVICNLYRHNGL